MALALALAIVAAVIFALVAVLRRPPRERRRAAIIAGAVTAVIAAVIALQEPVEKLMYQRRMREAYEAKCATRWSANYRASVASAIEQCARSPEDSTFCFEHGASYRITGDGKSAAEFLRIACERGQETACTYLADVSDWYDECADRPE